MNWIRTLAVISASVSVAWTADIPGNPDRGAEIFTSKQCSTCHSVDGSGSGTAPDLAKNPSGRFTPAVLARTIWNHGPAMWGAMAEAGVTKRDLNYQDAADLFAYLFSLRTLQEPGDVNRGMDVFASKGCINCHANGENGAPPLAEWESVDDPIQLARAMWNHAPRMQASMDIDWPRLTGQDIADVLAYVRSVPDAPRGQPRFAPAAADTGEMLFTAKRCNRCHGANQPRIGDGGPHSLEGLAAGMWNHSPEMWPTAQEIRPEEMTRLIGYLWSLQYFDGDGDPAVGLEVAVRRGCTGCHAQPSGTAPAFSAYAGQMDPIRLISDAWTHAEGMQRAMQDAGRAWPVLQGDDVLNIVAYVNSLR